MTSAQQKLYTSAEYLALERSAGFKSEYLRGQIYAMAGASPEHSAITVNVTVELGMQLRGKPCQALSSDMKVSGASTGLFAYPDLSVVCGEPRFHDQERDVLLNPTLIIEVLSPSTEAYDRGRKFFLYRQIKSLTDYLLIAQDAPRIDHYVRQADDRWLLTTANGLEAQLYIASIDCTLRLSEVYARIQFQPDILPFFSDR